MTGERLQRLALTGPDAAGDRDGYRFGHSSVLDASGSPAGSTASVVSAASAVGDLCGLVGRGFLGFGGRKLVWSLFLGRLGFGFLLGLGFFRGLGLRCVHQLERRRLVGEDVLRQIDRRPGVHRLRSVRARLDGIGVLDPLEREREAAALAVDLDDLHVDRLALRDDLARVLDVMLRELRDVHEPFDAGKDLDEGSERDDLGHAPLDDVVLVVALHHLLPRIALGLLETERDALAIAVDVENLDLHRLADVEHLGRMVDMRPRELGDVDEAVHPVEIDERAEVDDVGDLALDDVARLKLVEDLLPLLLALFLEHGAARQDDVVPRTVELDHLRAQLLAHELVEVLHAADVDERRGQEAANAEVENETALDDLDHAAVDRISGLGGLLDRLPRELEPCALLREDQTPFGVLLREHERVDLVAERDLVGGVDRAANRELGDGNDALRLVADVDENLVLVDPDDRPVDDLPLVDLGEGGVVVGDQLAVRAFDPDTGFKLHEIVGSQSGREV